MSDASKKQRLIGVMGAMSEETDEILQKMQVESCHELGGRKYHVGKLNGCRLVLVLSRWGKVASAVTATTLICHFRVESIVFLGVAGGAAPEMEIGDIVVARELVQHDMDASPVPGLKKFEIPLLGVSHFQANEGMRNILSSAARDFIRELNGQEEVAQKLRAAGVMQTPKVCEGLIASGDRFIADPLFLNQLRSELPGLLCVEMEGASVAQVCHEHNIPFAVVRTLSDKADHSAVVDFPKFLKEVARWFSSEIITRALPALSNV